jgi:TctA family transporter
MNLRQALLISDGNFIDFFMRPISAVTLGLAILLLASATFPFVKKRLQQYKESIDEE